MNPVRVFELLLKFTLISFSPTLDLYMRCSMLEVSAEIFGFWYFYFILFLKKEFFRYYNRYSLDSTIFICSNFKKTACCAKERHDGKVSYYIKDREILDISSFIFPHFKKSKLVKQIRQPQHFFLQFIRMRDENSEVKNGQKKYSLPPSLISKVCLI